MSEAYLWEFLDVHDDITIVDSFVKANSVINSPLYETILCSISGESEYKKALSNIRTSLKEVSSEMKLKEDKTQIAGQMSISDFIEGASNG